MRNTKMLTSKLVILLLCFGPIVQTIATTPIKNPIHDEPTGHIHRSGDLISAGLIQSLPGGQEDIPIDANIKNNVTTALKHYSATTGGSNEPHLVKIISATRQVVAGKLLRIKVRIGESNCTKGQTANICLLQEDKPIKDCLIKILSQPWLNKPEEITVECDSTDNRKRRSLQNTGYPNVKFNMAQKRDDVEQRKRRQIGTPVTGGEEKIPIDENIKNNVTAALKHYSATSGGNNEPHLKEIVSATRQVVAGSLLRIKVKIGESNCTKGQTANICLLQEDEPIKDCLIKIWSQPWMDKNDEITVECDQIDSRTGKSLQKTEYPIEKLDMTQNLRDYEPLKIIRIPA